MKYLDYLNENQLKAVKETEGYVRVIAGPGSGKTKTLVSRYLYLVESGISTDNILCITFTNKAANVMKNRIKTILGDNFNGIIDTFHGYCAKLLRDEIYHINFPKSFTIFDDLDKAKLFKEIYEEYNLKKTEYNYLRMETEILSYKEHNRDEYIEYLLDLDNIKTINCKPYVKSYIDNEKKYKYLDFDDLIFITLYIFDKYEDIKTKYQLKYQYVMVDEFQDITPREFHLLDILSKYYKNLFVVGDLDQMIYSFRGARDYIKQFDTIYKTAKTFYLDINYRSTPEIINLANSLIKHNKSRIDYKMTTLNKNGELPIIYHALTREKEAAFIVDEIKKLVNNNVSLNDIAIIYRSNFLSRFIEDALINEKIKYRIYGGISFYDRKEIKDILSYLRFLIKEDDLSFNRIINEPSRKIGNKKIEFLKDVSIKNNCSLYEALKNNIDNPILKGSKAKEFVELINILKNDIGSKKKLSLILSNIYTFSGYEKMLTLEAKDDKIENIKELFTVIKKLEDREDDLIDPSDYLLNLELSKKEDDLVKEKKEEVKLMTSHISKGQEFKYVFVVGVNEDVFPSIKSTTEQEIEEERRLFYVSITRAKEMVYITESADFNYTYTELSPSRFIYELDKSCYKLMGDLKELSYIQAKIDIMHKRYNEEKENESKYKVGMKVYSPIFKYGEIVNVNENKNTIDVKFDNIETLRTLSFNNNLEII